MPKDSNNTEVLDFPASWIKPDMPGFGTFPWPHVSESENYEAVARGMLETIEQALSIGYRHIDTAYSYRNQDQVGLAVRNAGISRDSVFVTSKLDQRDNEYDIARLKISQAIDLIWGESSANDRYLDAFLLHYPGKGNPAQAWKALQEAKDAGIIKHIGVSNFDVWHLEKLRKVSGQLPEINQIELHPWIYQEQSELIGYCKENDVVLEGYSPLAQGKALSDPILLQMASDHDATPARIVLKWCMQHGIRPIIGSRNIDHLRKNSEAYMFELDSDEMQTLNGLGDKHVIRVSEQWHWNPKQATFGGESR